LGWGVGEVEVNKEYSQTKKNHRTSYEKVLHRGQKKGGRGKCSGSGREGR